MGFAPSGIPSRTISTIKPICQILKPAPGLASLSHASLPVETFADVVLNEIDPSTPIREIPSQGVSFFDSEFEAEPPSIRIT